MTAIDFKDFAAGLQSIATCIAFAVGGWWTYKRFGVEREGVPRVEFTVDVRFVGTHGDHVVLELIANVTNKGKVRHEIRDFKYELLYINADDELPLRRSSLGHEIDYSRVAASGSWLSPGFEYTFVEPGTAVKYSNSAAVPRAASLVLLAGRFVFTHANEAYTAETVVSVKSFLHQDESDDVTTAR